MTCLLIKDIFNMNLIQVEGPQTFKNLNCLNVENKKYVSNLFYKIATIK